MDKAGWGWSISKSWNWETENLTLSQKEYGMVFGTGPLILRQTV